MDSIHKLLKLSLLFILLLNFAQCEEEIEFNYGEEEGEEVECPEYVETQFVKGHELLFYPCCLPQNTVCDDTYDPVCVEKDDCEGDDCYITVTNMCHACIGEHYYLNQYAKQACPTKRACKKGTKNSSDLE